MASLDEFESRLELESEDETASESKCKSESKSTSISGSDLESEYEYENSEEEDLEAKYKSVIEEDKSNSRSFSTASSSHQGSFNASCKQRRIWDWIHFDTSLSYFKEKMKECLDFPMRPYKMPTKSTDIAELEPSPFEEKKPYRPILIEITDKNGKKIVVQRVVGFRELLNKRERIQSLIEQEELRQEYLARPEWMAQRMVTDSNDSDTVKEFIQELPVGGEKERKKKLTKKRTKGTNKSRASSASSNSKARSAAGKRPKRAPREKRTTSVVINKSGSSKTRSGKHNSSKNNKSEDKSKKNMDGRRKPSFIPKKKEHKSEIDGEMKGGAGRAANNKHHNRGAVNDPTSRARGNTARANQSKYRVTKPSFYDGLTGHKVDEIRHNTSHTSLYKLSVPSHVIKKKILKKPTLYKVESKPKKAFSKKPISNVPQPGTSSAKSPKQNNNTIKLKTVLKKPNTKKKLSSIPKVRVESIATPGLEEADMNRAPPGHFIRFIAEENKSILVPNIPVYIYHPAVPKSVTFDESVPQQPENNETSGKPVGAKRHKHHHRHRQPTLTAEEIEAVRKHDLHMERDAEWLELSPTVTEIDSNKSQTFIKEKLPWMKKGLSYESQLIDKELSLYMNGLTITGRQPFHSKDDMELGVIQYVVDRKKQIPFAITSLFLWIATVFIFQGYIDVSITNAENTQNEYTAKLEKIELEKYRVLLIAFMANLFFASLWSITVLLKDGLFLCQYMNSLLASLTQMEISGAGGIKYLTWCNYILVLLYSTTLTIAFVLDWPKTVKGSSGLISMMLFRSFYPKLKHKTKDSFMYFEIFGLIFHIYVIYCARNILTLMQLLASVLRRAAQKWNFKFGLKFGQFGYRSRGQLVRLKLNQSLLKIFIHHRYIVGLTSLYGRVFATPIALYFSLQLSVFTYYLVYLYRYKQRKPKDFGGHENYTYLDTDDNMTTMFHNYHTKLEDYLTAYWVIILTLIDFIFTSESIAGAGNAVITGFEFVRRRGQILCANSHERRLIQSLQWSFSATNPCVINVNKFFTVNRSNIINGLGTALIMFSLIIQLNQDKTMLVIDKQPCGYEYDGSERFCFVKKRILAPPVVKPTPKVKLTILPSLNKQMTPYENRYWFWEDCEMIKETYGNSSDVETFLPESLKFNYSSNLPVCFKLSHMDDALSMYPEYNVNESIFKILMAHWKNRTNGTNTDRDINKYNCKGVGFIERLKNNFHICYSNITRKYLLLQDVYICPGCPLVWLRSLRNNTDCNINPYPISPFYTSTTPTPNEPIIIFHKKNITNTTGLRRLGYFDCDGNEIDTEQESRDDCGWIPLPRINNKDVPILHNVIPGKIYKLPDAGGAIINSVNTSKSCYSHNMERCTNLNLNKYCAWSNYDSRGYDQFEQGYLYGSDCYDRSLFFNFTKPDEFGFCSHWIPTLLLETDGRLHTQKEVDDAKVQWNKLLPERPTSCPSCSGGKYDYNVPPCKTNFSNHMKGNFEMNGFTQAKDFRRICRDSKNEIKGFVNHVYKLVNSEYILDVSKTSSSCWDSPYDPNQTNVTDCWGKPIDLDDCYSTSEAKYVGPFYRDSKLVDNLEIKKIINIKVTHHFIDERNKTPVEISRSCWNTEFEIARCNDPNIICAKDKEPHEKVYFYGEECLNPKYGLVLDEYYWCSKTLPSYVIDNITFFSMKAYDDREFHYKNTNASYSIHKDCFKNTSPSIWYCNKTVGSFPDFTYVGPTSYLPCHNTRINASNCTSNKLCQEINPIVESINFRIPCRDKDGVVRAMIPRLIYSTASTHMSYMNLWTIPVDSLRHDQKLTCWENPYLLPNFFNLIWEHPIDNAYTCWDKTGPAIQDFNDLDDCGWYPIEKFATGLEPKITFFKKTINVTINSTLTLERECWSDSFSQERCKDPNITCKYDKTEQVVFYGKDCVFHNVTPDVYDWCNKKLPSSLIDNIHYFPNKTYENRTTQYDNTDAQYSTYQNCTKVNPVPNHTPRWNCKETVGSFPDFQDKQMPIGLYGQFPCLAMQEMRNNCNRTKNKGCQEINPIVESINFRIPCRDKNNKIRAMIPRFIYRSSLPNNSMGYNLSGQYYELQTMRMNELRKNLTCWENPILNSNFSLIWDPSEFNDATNYGPYTCWGGEINETNLDDCGWYPFEKLTTGTKPMSVTEYTMININVTVDSIPVTRKCWNESFAIERCNDPSITCQNDHLFSQILVFYGNDCVKHNVTRDEYDWCNKTLPITMLDSISYFPISIYEKRNKHYKDTDANHSHFKCDKPSSRLEDWKCDETIGSFPDFVYNKDWSLYFKHPCIAIRQHRTNCNATNNWPCKEINPLIESINFRVPCRDKNDKVRAMMPRFILSTINTSSKHFFLFSTMTMNKWREKQNLTCWENPILNTTWDFIWKPQQKLGGPFPPEHPSTCWGSGQINNVSQLDDCGWYPFEKFATGYESLVKYIKIPMDVKINGTIVKRNCWNDTLSQDTIWPESSANWLKNVSWGFRKLLNWLKLTYGNPEIYITENGFADYPDTGLIDTGRVNYYKDYINNMLKAINVDGCNVTKYTAWSLLDSFEWAKGYSERFGVHHVDFENPERPRTPKKSAELLKKIFEDNGFIEPEVPTTDQTSTIQESTTVNSGITENTSEPTENPVTEPTETPRTDPTGNPVTEPTETPRTEPPEPPRTEPTGNNSGINFSFDIYVVIITTLIALNRNLVKYI